MIVQDWITGSYEVRSRIVDEPDLVYRETLDTDRDVLHHFIPDLVHVQWIITDDGWELQALTISGRRILKSGALGRQRESRTWHWGALKRGEAPAWVNDHLASLAGPPKGA